MLNSDFIHFIPEIFLIVSTLITSLYGLVYSTSKHYNYPNMVKTVSWLGLLILCITFLLITYQYEILCAKNTEVVIFYNSIRVNVYTCLVRGMIVFFSFLCLGSSIAYFKGSEITTYENVILLLFSVFGMLVLTGSYNLAVLYIGLEVQSFSFYILAAYKTRSTYSSEAGLKYFIIGAISSGFLLFGIAIIYSLTGSIYFSEICKYSAGLEIDTLGFTWSKLGLLVGFIFVITSFFNKIRSRPLPFMGI